MAKSYEEFAKKLAESVGDSGTVGQAFKRDSSGKMQPTSLKDPIFGKGMPKSGSTGSSKTTYTKSPFQAGTTASS